MLASFNAPTCRPKLGSPWLDFEWLGWRMGLPPDLRKLFALWLATSLHAEWRHAAEPPTTVKGNHASIDANTARAGRAFIQWIERRDALSTGADLRDWTMIKGVREYLQHVKKVRSPRRRDRSATFLETMLDIICALGGRVTFTRRTGKGSVIELIDDLRPHLPVGFIPAVPTSRLSHATIERVCARARLLGRRIASGLGAPVTIEPLRRHVCKEGQMAVIEAQQRARARTTAGR
jgi:hypothetical protein